MSEDIYQFIFRFFIFYLPLLFSLCVHESAHAWMACVKGDTLARDQGRLSLNPLVHADIIGTFLLPLMSIFFGLPVFGWAKPVPVNEYILKNPKEDMFWIALAGPLSNFCLAIVGAILLAVVYKFSGFLNSVFIKTGILNQIFETFIYLNLLLGFFNLLPIHPLDGGKVLNRFLSHKWRLRQAQLEHYTSYILIALFITGGIKYLVLPVYWIAEQLIDFVKYVTNFI